MTLHWFYWLFRRCFPRLIYGVVLTLHGIKNRAKRITGY